MLTLGNADAPAGKISREGNHRHVTHMGKKDQNKEGKVPLSYPLSLVVHALALAVFHLWVTCSLPAISKYHFSSKVTYCTFPCTLILVNSLHVICSNQTGLHLRIFNKGKVQKKKLKKIITSVSFMYVCVAENVELLVFFLLFLHP